MKAVLSVLFSLLLFTEIVQAQISYKEHQELGQVQWNRNYAEACELSAQEGKPILLLFQEVPGCATCRNYGSQVLSHPLLVEAIELNFIPLVIFNNKGGKDKEILEKYKEPSWNNPVVRIINHRGLDIAPRLSGNYSIDGLSRQMILALNKEGIAVPTYLSLLKQASQNGKNEDRYYKMYCFWTGESHLGSPEGVVATEPGWMSGAEVVKVTYNPLVVQPKELDSYAAKANCKNIKYDASYRIDKDPQYYLKNSNYRHLPLMAIQKTKINAALKSGSDPDQFLSPQQLIWKKSNSHKKDLYDKPFLKAWELNKKEG